jgi:hypothetical protein
MAIVVPTYLLDGCCCQAQISWEQRSVGIDSILWAEGYVNDRAQVSGGPAYDTINPGDPETNYAALASSYLVTDGAWIPHLSNPGQQADKWRVWTMYSGSLHTDSVRSYTYHSRLVARYPLPGGSPTPVNYPLAAAIVEIRTRQYTEWRSGVIQETMDGGSTDTTLLLQFHGGDGCLVSDPIIPPGATDPTPTGWAWWDEHAMDGMGLGRQDFSVIDILRVVRLIPAT